LAGGCRDLDDEWCEPNVGWARDGMDKVASKAQHAARHCRDYGERPKARVVATAGTSNAACTTTFAHVDTAITDWFPHARWPFDETSDGRVKHVCMVRKPEFAFSGREFLIHVGMGFNVAPLVARPVLNN
jgi:hypothetical protein